MSIGVSKKSGYQCVFVDGYHDGYDSSSVQAKVGDILFAVNKESLFPCNGSILRLKELKDKGDGKPVEYGFLRIRTIAQNAISYSSLNK
ncbi:hypothetical protein TL16_g08956 [Triparma laevis f. inornata]|uniref:PDZ domain-containing protein n=1 Tax=Triparma laevis f. inornata TaxID=1714386 RepID=A0A9W7B8H6_9STRA|nr:hypothetical protein TL16_g08956 [Triparma laevis f. inornata]